MAAKQESRAGVRPGDGGRFRDDHDDGQDGGGDDDDVVETMMMRKQICQPSCKV